MAHSPETKNNLDQAPEPASPEELEQFKILVHTKVHTSGKAVKYHDPIAEDVEIITAMWTPALNMEVHADIGTTHEPDYVDILINENFGRVKGIDTAIRKHFRFFPIAGVSEQELELVESHDGKRLMSEEVVRAIQAMEEADEQTLDEEKQRMIEDARDKSKTYKGMGIPPIDKSSLSEVIAILARCNPSNAETPPQIVNGF
jgi:hypothetical protein